MSQLTQLDPMNYAALATYIVAWIVLGWWIEHPTAKRPSMTVLMSERRRDWMKVFVTRTPRIFDSQIMMNLRQSTTFFASTSLLAIGGVLAMIGNIEPLSGVTAQVISHETPVIILQLKLAVVILFLTDAFLKFVWSNRVFGYCAVLMASVPEDLSDPVCYPRAAQAAELNIRAAHNFNRGLRSLYFALGALGWLLGPVVLMLSMVAVIWVVWTREFASIPRTIILKDMP